MSNTATTNEIETVEPVDEDDLFEDFEKYKKTEVDDTIIHWQDNWEDEGADEFTTQIKQSLK